VERRRTATATGLYDSFCHTQLDKPNKITQMSFGYIQSFHAQPMWTTKGSAVVERLRDASCLSVVSFNSTIHRAQSLTISYFRCTNAYIQIMFCCLRCNVEAFCHKQDSLMRDAAAFVDRGRQTTHKYYKLYFTVDVDDMRRSSSDRCQKQTLVENRDFCPS